MQRPSNNGSLGRGVQATTRGGVQVITSPDGLSTTITDRGRVTTLTTSPAGNVTVTVNGRPAEDPRALNDAIARIAVTSQAPREDGIRVNGRALQDDEMLAGGVAAGAAAGILATIVLVVIVRLISRLVRRREHRTSVVDVSPRLDRIEQAVETIALEVERVSEAQRYSARLLTERLPAPVRAPSAARAEARVLTPR